MYKGRFEILDSKLILRVTSPLDSLLGILNMYVDVTILHCGIKFRATLYDYAQNCFCPPNTFFFIPADLEVLDDKANTEFDIVIEKVTGVSIL